MLAWCSRHPLTDARRLADHHAGAVVDEEARADAGTGVDVDAGGAVCQLGHDACQQWQALAVQLVGQAVVQHGQDAGVAQQHLIHAARCRIAMEGSQHIAVEQAADAGQGLGKLLHHLGGLGAYRHVLYQAQLQPQFLLY